MTRKRISRGSRCGLRAGLMLPWQRRSLTRESHRTSGYGAGCCRQASIATSRPSIRQRFPRSAGSVRNGCGEVDLGLDAQRMFLQELAAYADEPRWPEDPAGAGCHSCRLPAAASSSAALRVPVPVRPALDQSADDQLLHAPIVTGGQVAYP